jgi:hypothetical protein
MDGSVPKFAAVVKRIEANRRCFLGGSDARIMGGDEAVLMRPSPEQNIQMKSQRCPGLLREDARPTNARAAKSSAAQAQRLRPFGRKYSRAGHRQQETAAKLATFMTGIRRLMKAYATLRQKLYACLSEHTFDQANRIQGSRVATRLDLDDPVSMQTGRLGQIHQPATARAIRICALTRARKPR